MISSSSLSCSTSSATLRSCGYRPDDIDRFVGSVSGNLGNDPIDGVDTRRRRARAAALNIVPTSTGAARTGTLTIAGQTVTVNQSGISCSYSVSTTSLTAPSTGTNSMGASLMRSANRGSGRGREGRMEGRLAQASQFAH